MELTVAGVGLRFVMTYGSRSVRVAWTILIGLLLALGLGLLVWLMERPASTDAAEGMPAAPRATAPATQAADARPLSIGLVPERDIFAQRKRYQALAAYLAAKLGRSVELVTVNTYESVLQDLAEKKVDAAFLGSLVAGLTFDRLGAQVLAKPEDAEGISTYRGVIFVRDDSPVRSLTDLRGRSIAMVRTTTAAHLFPMQQMLEQGLLNGADAPRPVWVGTHDDVILETMDGRADAGAVKDRRLDAFEKRHPQWKVRRLAASEMVPDNALVVRADLASGLGVQLRDVLLAMDRDPDGRTALQAMGMTRFVPCSVSDYQALYDLIDKMGDDWPRLQIDGNRPRRPRQLPSTMPATATARE
jgi:phosphonate transport system substrate-binding protein